MMSRGHPTTTTRRRTKLSRLYISLFILSISSQTVSNMYLREIFYIIAHRLVCWTMCPDEHTIQKKTIWAIYNDRTQFWLPTCLLGITHILLRWIVCVHLNHRKRFIRANCMPYIAHTLIWFPVSVVLPYCKKFFWINHMPCIAHTTKIWHVFDAFVIANILNIFDGSLTPLFAIIASHTVSRRVFDSSVALAASCNSGYTWKSLPGNSSRGILLPPPYKDRTEWQPEWLRCPDPRAYSETRCYPCCSTIMGSLWIEEAGNIALSR